TTSTDIFAPVKADSFTQYLATIIRLLLFIYRREPEQFRGSFDEESLELVADRFWNVLYGWREQMRGSINQPLKSFMAAIMLMKEEKETMAIRFKPAKTFTSATAHLQYFARLWILIRLKSFEGGAEEEESFLAEMTNLVSKSPLKGDQTPFSALKAWAALVSLINETPPEREYAWKNGEVNRIALYRGHEVSLKMMGTVVLCCIEDGWTLLWERLFFGFDVGFGDVAVSKLYATSGGTQFDLVSNGRGMLDDPNLNLAERKSAFWTLLDEIPDIGSKFLRESESMMASEKIYDKKMMMEWCSVFEDLQDLCLVAVHLSGGMPARATELVKLALRGGSHTNFSLFLSAEGELGIHQTYHKMRNTTNKNANVTRYLPDSVGNLLLALLIFCRDPYM
ncbi:hypothetical protein HDV05_000667, partial [Chytridiales sp. JEL 0842]